jgi:hypothetical protein
MSESDFWQYMVVNWIEIVMIIITSVLLVILILVIIRLLNRRNLKKREMVWLELTPPVSVTRTPEATEQLFSVIHGMYITQHFIEKLFGRLPVLSFEITSTKPGGIRYLIQVEKSKSPSLNKAISAYIPDVKVKQISMTNQKADFVAEFKETSHYILPLTLMSDSDKHDPLSYVTNAMTKLDEADWITMQLILTPIKLHEASRLAHKILSNEDILSSVSGGQFILLQRIGLVISNVLLGITNLISEVCRGATSTASVAHSQHDTNLKTQVAKGLRPARTLSVFEQELMESMHHKVTQPLFRVNLRILAGGKQSREYIAGIRSALDGYSVPLYQSLKAKFSPPIVGRYRKALADNRLPAFFGRNQIVLSTDEVASLYHFPSYRLSRTDNLTTSLSKTLSAPLSLKNGTKLDVLVGINKHHGVDTLIGLTEKERERHMYVIGGTGNGKTTMLQYMIIQDIEHGKGVAVIDPHGDMAQEILMHIPKERINDVIYFNPDDLTYPIGMNLLEIDPTLTGDELLKAKDLVTESIVSIFRKLFSDDGSGGHRVEYILRNAIQTALTVEDCTIFTIYKLLNDMKFRKSVVNNLDDHDLKSFWDNEIGRAGNMQKVKMVAGVTSKIGRFLFSTFTKRILGQTKSTIDFEDIINSGKILICNFSKGLIGEDTSALLGTAVISQLQLASLKRAKLSQAERRPYYLYVDEFQNFATMSFVQMLSESRKYKLYLNMAEQSTSQQKDRDMVNTILANVGTVVCFRTGNPVDEQVMLPFFSPYVDEGEIMNLPPFNFYMRLAAVHSQEPLSGETILLDNNGDKKIVKVAIEHSRQAFTVYCKVS